MDFFNFPSDWGNFSTFINWLFNQGLNIVFLVWVLNFLFSILHETLRHLTHNGGRL